MDYPSLRWRGKSSSGFEFRRENGLAVQVFRNSSVSLDFVYRELRQTPETPKNDEIGQMTTETRQGEYIFLILFKKSNI